MINFEAVEFEQASDTTVAEVAGALAVETFGGRLNSQENEALRWASLGLTNTEIAEKMSAEGRVFTINIVKEDLKHAFDVLGAQNRPHAVSILIKQGVIPLEVKLAGPKLPPKVAEVMPLVAAGFNNDEIATRLGRGKETIKTQIRTALEVLGANNRAQAVRRMYETGLWELPEAS